MKTLIKDIKGTVSVISSDPPLKDGNTRFTRRPGSFEILLNKVSLTTTVDKVFIQKK